MRRNSAPAVQAEKAASKSTLSRKVVPGLAAAALLASLGGTAAATTAPSTGATAQPVGGATAVKLVKTERHAPAKRKVRRVRFRPWDRPSPRQVRKIVNVEAKRWKVSAAGLSRRIACESRFNWAAGNGQYRGLLQFAPSTFYRGMSSIRTRKVKLVRKRSRTVREVVIKTYSDGRVVRSKGRKHRQALIRISRGKIPARPAMTHGWAQVRIGAQAMRGVSAVSSSEWACGA